MGPSNWNQASEHILLKASFQPKSYCYQQLLEPVPISYQKLKRCITYVEPALGKRGAGRTGGLHEQLEPTIGAPYPESILSIQILLLPAAPRTSTYKLSKAETVHNVRGTCFGQTGGGTKRRATRAAGSQRHGQRTPQPQPQPHTPPGDLYIHLSGLPVDTTPTTLAWDQLFIDDSYPHLSGLPFDSSSTTLARGQLFIDDFYLHLSELPFDTSSTTSTSI